MGRGKVELKRIEDKNSRQVTFSKRRSGLIKKARELSILCETEIALFIFSARGRLYEFITGDSLRKILERYQINKDGEAAGGSVQEPSKFPAESANNWRGNNPLQMLQRHFEEQKVEQQDVTELTQLEHQLDAITRQLDAQLRKMRIRKSQLMREAVTALHGKKKQLWEDQQSMETEKKQLREDQQSMETEMGAMSNEASVDTDLHRRELLQQAKEVDPLVDLEIYAFDDDNTNTSTVPQPPL
ncbi:truncated transcription factor CAULIFLOWER A-like isoform X1 [Actinidia eriantha]|uniref:truncated transcription factor CAULIFLOWER A-like isoform X1 n=1 Tax=Actinidia eriantha TaxID=165200 RepID=UPI0025840A04|nr:truncated transcription factor CAULIFLOWER A-like isoform X1 [Actinidia eriantha]